MAQIIESTRDFDICGGLNPEEKRSLSVEGLMDLRADIP